MGAWRTVIHELLQEKLKKAVRGSTSFSARRSAPRTPLDAPSCAAHTGFANCRGVETVSRPPAIHSHSDSLKLHQPMQPSMDRGARR